MKAPNNFAVRITTFLGNAHELDYLRVFYKILDSFKSSKLVHKLYQGPPNCMAGRSLKRRGSYEVEVSQRRKNSFKRSISNLDINELPLAQGKYQKYVYYSGWYKTVCYIYNTGRRKRQITLHISLVFILLVQKYLHRRDSSAVMSTNCSCKKKT